MTIFPQHFFNAIDSLRVLSWLSLCQLTPFKKQQHKFDKIIVLTYWPEQRPQILKSDDIPGNHIILLTFSKYRIAAEIRCHIWRPISVRIFSKTYTENSDFSIILKHLFLKWFNHYMNQSGYENIFYSNCLKLSQL